MARSEIPALTEPVGLFPLPNVVLLPGGVLPLQVFEARYRSMVRDALADQSLIAMGLLRPGYEPYYYTNRAEIHPVVCVGLIREHVQVDDGRYFINLQGLCRARIRTEDRDGEYRLVTVDPMLPPASGIERDGEYAARQQLRQMLYSPAFEAVEGVERLRAFVDSPASLDEVLDEVASGVLPVEAVEIRQRLLEEVNVLRRTATVLAELQTIRATISVKLRRLDVWPRFGSMN